MKRDSARTFALITPVMTSAAESGGDDHVDPGGARLLRQTRDRALDVGGRGLHQIGQFVDDDHDVGMRSG